MKTLTRKSLRDLRRFWPQTLALITITALGVSSLIALSGAYRDLSLSYERTYARLNFADTTFSLRAAPESVLDEIRDLSSVEGATGRLVVDTGLYRPDGEIIQARLVGLPTARPSVNDVLLLDGSYFEDPDQMQVLVEAHFAEAFNLGPGDDVRPILDGQTETLTVRAVAASPEYLIVSPSRQRVLASARSYAVLFTPRRALQSLSGLEGQINNVVVTWRPGADVEAATAHVEELLEPYGLASTIQRSDHPSHAALQLDLEGYREIAYAMPGLILAVAAFSLYMMLARLVRSQEREIGVMKSLGYPTRTVVRHYLGYALLVTAAGVVVGVPLGLTLARSTTEAYAAELGIPLVASQAYPDLILVSVLISAGMALLAGWLPARHAAKLAPASAMRATPSQATPGLGSRIGAVRRFPLELRFTLRNLLRNLTRTGTTAAGILFAYVLILMSWGMIDSMQFLLDHSFEEIERWDMRLGFAQPVPASMIDRIDSMDGVGEVQAILQLPGEITTSDGTEEVLLNALDEPDGLHRLLPVPGYPAPDLSGNNAALIPSLAESLGLTRGSSFELSTPFGERQFAYQTGVDEIYASNVYVPLKTALTMLDASAPVYSTLYLTTEPGAPADLKEHFYGLPGVTEVQREEDLRQGWQSLLGLFFTFMGVMMAFAAAMVFGLLFNTATINVLERGREFATLRSIGTDRGRIARLVQLESVALWLLTLPIGLILGHWTTVQMGQVFSGTLFSFRVVIATRSYILTALAILATMLLATWPSIRRVNRLDLAEATRTIS